MSLVLLIVALFVVGVTAAVALGWVRGGLADPRPSRPDHELPPGRLTVGDVAGVRFSVAARGYRMDEVDQFVDRILAELRAHQIDVGELRAEFGRPVQDRPVPHRPVLEKPVLGGPVGESFDDSGP